MLGIPEDGGLHFAGRVGTGFTDKELTQAEEDTQRRWRPTNHPSTHGFPIRTLRV